MVWDDQGQLASLSDTATGGTSTYLYDTDGNLVLRTDPGQATLFLDGQQIVENTSTHALSGTRYYTLGGTTVADRSSTGDVQYLIPDRQGTDTLAIDYQTYQATRRTYTPFGQTRGMAPATWPGGDDGYVGGTPDTATGLENLGAREYDPQSGRFISADPLLETTDPTQLGGYDYAGNDPVTGSDPTGSATFCEDMCESGDYFATGQGEPSAATPAGHHQVFNKKGHLVSNHDDGVPYRPVPVYHGTPKPTVKPKPKPSRWALFKHDIAKGADIAYHASGASDVVGCATNPSWGGCAQAGLIVGGAVLTGGEDEVELIAAREAEEVAEGESTSLAEKAAEACEEVPHSFIGSTPVLEPGGGSIPIKDLKAGDTVESTDPQTGVTAPHTVQRVIKTTTDRQFTELDIVGAPGKKAHGGANKPATLTTTWHHPFWDVDTKQWTDASHLTPGTHLREANGTAALITHTRNYHSTAVTYDLTVTNLHTYYVLAGATPILVHNTTGEPCNIPTVRMRHYTNSRGKNGIVESGVIKASDQNKVFLVPAKGRLMSPRDAESTLGIGRGRGNNVLEFDAPADRVTSRYNAKFGITEWVADGDLEITNIQVRR